MLTATWLHPANKTLYTQDYIMISAAAAWRVNKAWVTNFWGGSDHRQVRCDITLGAKKRSHGSNSPTSHERRKATHTRPDMKRLQNEGVRNAFLDQVVKTPLADDNHRRWQNLEARLLSAAATHLGRRTADKKGWFTASEPQLLVATKNRDAAQQEYAKRPTGNTGRKLKATKKEVKCSARKAEEKWSESQIRIFCKRVVNGKRVHPKQVYDTMQEFADGLGDATSKRVSKDRRTPQGRLAKTDRERLKLAADHFKQVFNRTPAIDTAVINTLKARSTKTWLDEPPSVNEVAAHMRHLKTGKAAGLSGVQPDLYRALSFDQGATETITSWIRDIWNTGEVPQAWCKGRLAQVLKPGKDPTLAESYRGILIIEAAAKLMSAILNARLQRLAKDIGASERSGFMIGRGTSDSSFTLRTLLATRREFGHTTWVAFLDFVQAFDSVHRETLFEVLRRYGCPPPNYWG